MVLLSNAWQIEDIQTITQWLSRKLKATSNSNLNNFILVKSSISNTWNKSREETLSLIWSIYLKIYLRKKVWKCTLKGLINNIYVNEQGDFTGTCLFYA